MQWVAGVAVEMTGGPAVPLLPGREDCNCFDDASLIPDECDTAETQVAFWSEPQLIIQRHVWGISSQLHHQTSCLQSSGSKVKV